MTPGQPHPPPTTQPSGWTVETRDGTGLFVVSERHKTLLFRFDPTAKTIYCWDKKAQREIPIPLAQLQGLPVMAL